ncbi:unnamed protein product [marine sediment metagenome]|uniref:Uncharacterized protein n=1 Tax=marine sediment metagenome TaxID=412755 RepID=X0WH98_9ZZZZ
MEPKFKEGEKVKCIGKSSGESDGSLQYAGAGWKKDLIFKVTHTDKTVRGYCYFGGYRNNGVYEEFLGLPKVTNWKERIQNGV